MFIFRYIGKFDCLISKNIFENYVENLYNNLKKCFNISWSPKKFIVIMEIDLKKKRGIGGCTDYDRKTDIIFRLHLQLFGYNKNDITFSILEKFFGYTLTHEMLHFFIPSVKNNSCWSEGVTDFMTFWYNNTISENLIKLTNEYKNITDPIYKKHKYGYITGFKKMAKLFKEDPSVINDMKHIIKDFNKNDMIKKKEYTEKDIINYNQKFKIFFNGKCNKHYKSVL
jgi:hypothetical protein